MVGWSILPRMTAGPGKDGEFNMLMFQTAEIIFSVNSGKIKLNFQLVPVHFL